MYWIAMLWLYKFLRAISPAAHLQQVMEYIHKPTISVSRLQRSLEPADSLSVFAYEADRVSNGNSDAASACARPVARTSSRLISCSSKIAECHRVQSTGWRTRIAPARASHSLLVRLSKLLFLLGDRLNAQHCIYLGHRAYTHVRTAWNIYDYVSRRTFL